MVEAVSTGLIDIISSQHTPQDEESKRLPFEAAASGAVGLKRFYRGAAPISFWASILEPNFQGRVLNPAKRLGLKTGRIDIGSPADLMLFDADVPYVLNRENLHSKSKNTPFDEARLQGKVLRTFVGGQEVYRA